MTEVTPTRNGMCETCDKGTSKRCTACLTVYYCSTECQKSGWREHKTDCTGQRREPEAGLVPAVTNDVQRMPIGTDNSTTQPILDLQQYHHAIGIPMHSDETEIQGTSEETTVGNDDSHAEDTRNSETIPTVSIQRISSREVSNLLRTTNLPGNL